MKSEARPTASKVLVVIPAWNEGAVIGSVIDEIGEKFPQGDILVVSDGSTDDTVLQARKRAVTVVDLPLNLGVGGAMRAGFLYAQRKGYKWAVQLDADGQHDPADIPRLLQTADETNADVVIGARFAGKGEYRARGPRRWAMVLMASVLSPVVHSKLTDTTSGFKLNSQRAIEVFSRDYPAEYLGDTVGALVVAARESLKVAQAPVVMRPRQGGQPSHGALASTRFLLRAWLSLAVSLTRRSSGTSVRSA